MRRVFIDANIVLDLLDDKRPFHSSSINAISELIDNDWDLVTTEDILTNVYYIASEKVKVINFFSEILKQWIIVDFGKNVIEEALKNCSQNSHFDLEDILQCLAAKKAGCSVILTNDKGFPDCGILVKSAENISEKTELE